MMIPRLTPTQNRVFDYIEKYLESHKYPPSNSEIARAVNITSQAVYYIMYKLDELGYIEFIGSRQMRLLWKR